MTVGPEWISAVGTAVAGIGAAFTAWFAYRGVTVWKDQITFRRKSDLAEQILEGFYQAQETLRYARVWVRWAGEGEGRPGEKEEPEELKRMLDDFFVPVERLHNKSEFFSVFFALQWRAKAVFGDEIFEKFRFMLKKHRELENAAFGLMRLYREAFYNNDILEKQEKFITNMKRILGRDIEGTEYFDEEVAQIVSDVEQICKRYIE